MGGAEVYGLLKRLANAETTMNLLKAEGSKQEQETSRKEYEGLIEQVSKLTPDDLLRYHRHVQALREVDKADARQSERLKKYTGSLGPY